MCELWAKYRSQADFRWESKTGQPAILPFATALGDFRFLPRGHGRNGAGMNPASYLPSLTAHSEYPPWLNPYLRRLPSNSVQSSVALLEFFGEQSGPKSARVWRSVIFRTQILRVPHRPSLAGSASKCAHQRRDNHLSNMTGWSLGWPRFDEPSKPIMRSGRRPCPQSPKSPLTFIVFASSTRKSICSSIIF